MERVALNLGQAADALGVSIPTMRQLVNRGDFPAFRLGSRWLIPRSALEDWAADQAAQRAVLEGLR